MKGLLAGILSFLLSLMGFLAAPFSGNTDDSLLYTVGLSSEMLYGAGDAPAEPSTETASTEQPSTEAPATGHAASGNPDGYLSQTVMIYMIGSDLESEGGMASMDIEEMEEAGIDTDRHNVVLYTGGADSWMNDTVSADKNSIFQLSDTGFEEVDTLERANMGKADTLSDFLNWVYENYKTESYALVLWNHGGGPNVGYGCDENYNYDCLTLAEMNQALSDSPFGEDNKLEWVSFDACLMASIEVAEVFAPYSRYLIASQESEPGYGHYYGYLACLNDGDATGDKVGKEIASNYIQYYEELVNYDSRYECDVTMSCMDLSKIENVTKAMDTVFSDAEEGISMGDYGEIVRSRTKTKAFGVFTTSDSYDLIDLYSLSEELSGLYESCSELQTALDAFVVVNETNVDGAHGVSVYYPYDNYEYQDYWMASYDSISPSEAYTRFLRTITGEEPDIDIEQVDNTETDVAYEDVDWTLHYDNVAARDGDGFAIKLTDEQKAYFSHANCAILIQDEDEEEGEIYGCMAIATTLTEDENSEIYVDMSKYVVEMNNEAGDAEYGGPVSISVPEVDRDMVQVSGLVNRFGTEFTDMETHSVIVNLKLNEDGKHYDVLQAIIDDEDTEDESEQDTSSEEETGSSLIAEKQYIDISDYTVFSNYYAMYIPTYEDDGSMKIISDWERSKWTEGREVNIEEGGITFSVIDIPEEEKDLYYCHFIVFDIYGNYHISDLVPLQ